jgi:hypothetical protein
VNTVKTTTASSQDDEDLYEDAYYRSELCPFRPSKACQQNCAHKVSRLNWNGINSNYFPSASHQEHFPVHTFLLLRLFLMLPFNVVILAFQLLFLPEIKCRVMKQWFALNGTIHSLVLCPGCFLTASEPRTSRTQELVSWSFIVPYWPHVLKRLPVAKANRPVAALPSTYCTLQHPRTSIWICTLRLNNRIAQYLVDSL